jgi:BASS family bile acid:Na+ symporter
MKLIKFIEEKFWLPFIVALVLGLLIPAFGKSLNFLIIPFLMMILFLTYLKTDLMEIISHIKNPVFLIYILFMFLLVIPAAVFGIFQFINPELAVGFLLLCSMPAGVASPVFTNIVKGNTSLTIMVSLISHLVAPFTVLLLFFLFTQKVLPIDLLGLSKTLLLLGFIPLLSAQIVRKTSQKFINSTRSYYGLISVLIISLIVYIAVANQSGEILNNPVNTFLDILWLYILFIFLHIAGYLTAFWRNKEDKIALSVSKTYLNNALALGLALVFFPPKIALLVALSEIPWTTTLGPFNYFLKKLK